MLKSLFLTFAILMGHMIFMSPAHALFLSPDRLIIKDGQRSAELVIANRGDKPVVVRFEWERRAMSADGKLKLIGKDETAPNYKPADPYLRFSPRQVILKPQQHQKIRVLVRRTGDLTDGEYHSHLLIKEEPIKIASENAPNGEETKNIQGKIELIVYRSIPVFLHHGKTNVNVTINDAYIHNKNGHDFLHLNVSNDSTRSVYANPKINCKKPDGNVVSHSVIALRLYSSAKNVKNDMQIPKVFGDIRQCTDVSVELLDRRDFEYSEKPMARSTAQMR